MSNAKNLDANKVLMHGCKKKKEKGDEVESILRGNNVITNQA